MFMFLLFGRKLFVYVLIRFVGNKALFLALCYHVKDYVWKLMNNMISSAEQQQLGKHREWKYIE